MKIHKKDQFEESPGQVSLARVPNQPGSYAVVMYIDRSISLCIGALGSHDLKRGYYSYVGSAFGPGGLRARLGHHVRGGRDRFHWHIDYLRTIGHVVEIWWTNDAIKREHDWAFIFREQMDMETPIKRFGSSDCTCVTHLFYSHNKPNIRRFSRLAHSHWNDHLRIHSAVNFTR